jgi:hypothetical protein
MSHTWSSQSTVYSPFLWWRLPTTDFLLFLASRTLPLITSRYSNHREITYCCHPQTNLLCCVQPPLPSNCRCLQSLNFVTAGVCLFREQRVFMLQFYSLHVSFLSGVISLQLQAGRWFSCRPSLSRSREVAIDWRNAVSVCGENSS